MSLTEGVKIKLYWLEQSRSQRILWLLEELQIPYELEVFHRDKVTMLAGPELKKIHALGKSPVISITHPGSTEPLVIAESGFITEYLLDHFSLGKSLLPNRYSNGEEGKIGGETEEWIRHRYFLHYAEGSLMTLLLLGLFTMKIQSSPVPFFLKPITNIIASKIRSGYLDANFKTHFSFLESQLSTAPGGGKYLCGPNLTGADILMSFPLISALAAHSSTGLTQERYPKLYSYIKALEEEPGYKRAVEKIIQSEGVFKALL
ncbi:Glutathione S-transferase 1 [Erysiphe necator]|uniref:glutathione transferase n=1 Tax=Uncinula necator TaxID=52586 RepID=A0A0B1PD49_UNCNE|nr:Glutathione S-transferase 1 [Erysiphe necator]KHJ34594.1 putative glutathione s-transferase [Erysiphe necator]